MRGYRAGAASEIVPKYLNIPKESRGQLCQRETDKWSIISTEIVPLSASIRRALLILSKSLLILRKMYCDCAENLTGIFHRCE
jgi:hypothetical protein